MRWHERKAWLPLLVFMVYGDRVVWQFDEELGFGYVDGDEIAHRYN